jgi:hypothetical protein
MTECSALLRYAVIGKVLKYYSAATATATATSSNSIVKLVATSQEGKVTTLRYQQVQTVRNNKPEMRKEHVWY